MNGEFYDLAKLVLYVKSSMQTNTERELPLGKHVNKILFYFLSTCDDHLDQPKVCDCGINWYRGLNARGIINIRLINFFAINDISKAGFANSANQGIVTTYANGKTTYWSADWCFDRNIKKWKVAYVEYDWPAGSNAVYTFPECRDEFEKALLDIEEFAHTLGFDWYANVFKEAYDILVDDNDPPIPEWVDDTIIELRGEQLKLFLAAARADVFGAMGSWNDSPPYVAHEKGLQEEYKRFSHNLYVSIKKAVMNAVNS